MSIVPESSKGVINGGGLKEKKPTPHFPSLGGRPLGLCIYKEANMLEARLGYPLHTQEGLSGLFWKARVGTVCLGVLDGETEA